MNDRAQIFTLEAFLASVVLLATLAFTLQVVAISSNTAGATDTEDRNQHFGLAVGALDEGIENGSLRDTLLYWDETRGQFYGSVDTEGYYIARSPPTSFGNSLEATFSDRQVRYNMDLYFPTNDSDRGHQRVIERGTPSDNAIRVVETITLYDQTQLVDENESQRSVTLAEIEADGNSTFYAPDMRPNTSIYNVLRVEVVVWKT